MSTASVGRWAIHIDLEGFGKLYEQENQVLLALGELMEGIFWIGCRCFPESPDRLFAHQFGDGFLIVSDFPEDTLDRAVGIALALLRHVSQTGRFAKATIAEGQFGDIQGCYPKTVLAAKAKNDGGCVPMGRGIMTIFPVMGTALIRAVGLAKKCPSGPLLAVAAAERGRLPAGLRLHEVPNLDLIVIDWINSDNALATSIANKAHLRSPSPASTLQLLAAYCRDQQLTEEWTSNVRRFLGVNMG